MFFLGHRHNRRRAGRNQGKARNHQQLYSQREYLYAHVMLLGQRVGTKLKLDDLRPLTDAAFLVPRRLLRMG